MVIFDTSIWIDHIREASPNLTALLESGMILMHPFVIGELACGNMRNRELTLSLLSDLPQCSVATHQEVLRFIEVHQLMRRGIGYVDVHLLAAATVSQAKLWTRDKRLHNIAAELKLEYQIQP